PRGAAPGDAAPVRPGGRGRGAAVPARRGRRVRLRRLGLRQRRPAGVPRAGGDGRPGRAGPGGAAPVARVVQQRGRRRPRAGVGPGGRRPAAGGGGVKVLVAMSGGVDSSVAAARLLAAGHEVVGVTMRLWGGESDTGCCSVTDVDDARRVAQQLGIPHHVWNFGDEFEARVVEPYVEAHRRGLAPNPCLECNRPPKFDRLARRAAAVGFDAVATGHHARVVERPDGTRRLARGVDRAKDQSYVLYVLGQRELARTLLPVGETTKDEVRAEAAALGLRT